MFGLVKLLHAADVETTVGKMIFLAKYAFSKANPLTTTVSFSALTALITIRWVKTKIPHVRWFYRLPEVLLVVVVSTFLSSRFDWHGRGLDILGAVDIQTGDRFIEFPLSKYTLKYLHQTTSTAALIAVVGFLDSIVAAKQNAARFGYSISPNRELVALGAANLAGSFVPATLPAFGSITRSRINGDVGGRSQMASLVCSGLILLATFFLLPWLYCLPKCVLAAMYVLPLLSFHCLIKPSFQRWARRIFPSRRGAPRCNLLLAHEGLGRLYCHVSHLCVFHRLGHTGRCCIWPPDLPVACRPPFK